MSKPDDDDDAISTESDQRCACCQRMRLCRMYILQMGEAAWVCKECRTGSGSAS